MYGGRPFRIERPSEGRSTGLQPLPLGSFLLRSSFSGQKGLIYFPRSVRPLNVVFTLLGFPAHFINGP